MRGQVLRTSAMLFCEDLAPGQPAGPEAVEATADRLLSCFAAYGHGATLRPVFDGMLPDVSADGCADAILSYHAGSWNQLTEALKEVQK